MESKKEIKKKINELDPSLIEELDRYLDYLIQKKPRESSGKFKQDWAGGLSNQKHSAIELQKNKMVPKQNKY